MWWGSYIGTPFVDGGRGRDGCDCWGLVRAVYRSELGVELPDYGEISARDLMRVARAIDAGKDGDDWQEVSDPLSFDVAVMRLPEGSRVGHVGIMVNRVGVLHIEEKTAAVVVPINHYSVRSRIVGFRRHISQCR